LKVLDVALAPGPWWIAPELRAGVGEPIRDRRERSAAAVAAVNELEFSGMKDRVGDT